MNTPAKQCSICLSYCDTEGKRLVPQPKFRRVRIGLPEPCQCQDCRDQATRIAATGRGHLPGIPRD